MNKTIEMILHFNNPGVPYNEREIRTIKGSLFMYGRESEIYYKTIHNIIRDKVFHIFGGMNYSLVLFKMSQGKNNYTDIKEGLIAHTIYTEKMVELENYERLFKIKYLINGKRNQN